MRLIDRYIFREIFSYGLLGLAVFTFIFFVPQLVRLMELVVRHSAGPGTMALLFACTLPSVFTFTIPMAVLLGVLIGLGRLSGDSEIIALAALGFNRKQILLPVGVLAGVTLLATLVITLQLGPASLHRLRQIEEQLRAGQASLEVQPRVFDERFPGIVLYVQDVEASATVWRGIFLAQVGKEQETRLTFAERAIVIPDSQQGKLQLHLKNGSSHEFTRSDPDHYGVTTFGESDLPVTVVDLGSKRRTERSVPEMAMSELLADTGATSREASVEFHRRLAFPAACLVFALLGVPVGVRPHRGGRAVGFVVTLLMICGYYLLFVAGAGLARRGAVPPAMGMWSANLIAALAGLAMLPGMDQIRGDTPWYRRFEEILYRIKHLGRKRRLTSVLESARNGAPPIPRTRRASGFPLLIDVYLVRNFLYYFTLFLAGFLFLFHSFTFFELLEDIGRHKIPISLVVRYFLYLTPQMVYQLLPVAALIAALVTLGVMSKNNEVVAFKASGISLYRLAVPMIVAGTLLAGAMFLLDDTYLPEANQRQDALRNQIKGRPAQTFFQPRRQWIFGENAKLYNYDLFDPDRNLFGGLSVMELDPATFQLRRRIFATRARWEGRMNTWILEEGWVREFTNGNVSPYTRLAAFTMPELTEPPTYFNREVRSFYQLNWYELRRYIDDLSQAGFDVARLTVQWHKKFAFPLIAPVIVFLAVPFAFLVGTRGAVGGLAAGVGIGMIYWGISAFFEALGAVGQLPPLLAGWAPTAIFGFVGLYFFLRMKT